MQNLLSLVIATQFKFMLKVRIIDIIQMPQVLAYRVISPCIIYILNSLAWPDCINCFFHFLIVMIEQVISETI